MASIETHHINFSEFHELNNCLRRNSLRQTEDNRTRLLTIEAAEKKRLNKTKLTHDEIDLAVQEHKNRFD